MKTISQKRPVMIKWLVIFTLLFLSLPALATKPVVKKIFFFGDSTTGWLAERLQAYGEKNGFEVAALTWDGATMKKYANNAAKLKKYITDAHPDAVFISLGMNDMGARNPSASLSGYLETFKKTIGNIPIIWVGPASWPGKPSYGPSYCTWLSSTIGADHFFNSLNLTLPRQSKTNPHPTRKGVDKWMDAVITWIKDGKAAISLPGYAAPAKEYARPKSYTYKRMSAPL